MLVPSLLLILAGCSTLPAASNTPAAQAAPRDVLALPPVQADLEFPPGATEVSLAWLLTELGRLSGQELTLVPGLQSQLEAFKEPIEILTPVPASEVYTFVEALLLQQNVLLAPLKGGKRPVLGVFGGMNGGAFSATAQPIGVGEEHLDDLDAHPAVFCQLVLTFKNIDSRQLQTQLRQLMVDNTGTQLCVPCGERGLLLQGSGMKVARLARLLVEVDRASVSPPRTDAPPPGETPHPDGPSKPSSGG